MAAVRPTTPDMRAKYGLDQSISTQLVRYARAVVVADFGYSFAYQSPVVRVILERAPATLLLGFSALLLATIGGFTAGVWCATTQSRFVDGAVRVAASVAFSAPVFWTGEMLVILFAVKMQLLPVAGISTARASYDGIAHLFDVGRHLLLPALTLAVPFGAVVARVSRASMLEALREPFIQASYARGLSRVRVIVRHAAPNALVPVVALIGEHAAQIAAGAALTEALFGWPGIGDLVLHASLHRDYPLVTAAFILISASVVCFNAATDAVCASLDPRIAIR